MNESSSEQLTEADVATVPYEPPKIQVLGNLTDLTLAPKMFNASDGAMFYGVPEGFGS